MLGFLRAVGARHPCRFSLASACSSSRHRPGPSDFAVLLYAPSSRGIPAVALRLLLWERLQSRCSAFYAPSVRGIPAVFHSPPGERATFLCVATAPQERREQRSWPEGRRAGARSKETWPKERPPRCSGLRASCPATTQRGSGGSPTVHPWTDVERGAIPCAHPAGYPSVTLPQHRGPIHCASCAAKTKQLSERCSFALAFPSPVCGRRCPAARVGREKQAVSRHQRRKPNASAYANVGRRAPKAGYLPPSALACRDMTGRCKASPQPAPYQCQRKYDQKKRQSECNQPDCLSRTFSNRVNGFQSRMTYGRPA